MKPNVALPVRLSVVGGFLRDRAGAKDAPTVCFSGDPLLPPGPPRGEQLLATALKVGDVRGPIGRAAPLYLDMAPDGHVRHPEQILMAIGKHPMALAPLSEVFRLDPVGAFRGMAAFGSAP